eukprot:CAMPEP_0177650928 /NCGR_PEP_ID=MMETSP0447-20121125/12234_1 /TAXON_ID=0 /ORGANISM="Stygamoeba regulata, Strain BSH-02190019" /LENGTH=276 /DNA_ID=CAMNT_0019153891 /DNA_START=192 /DNA_END=1022 /DNA_ORIENTATION=-
MFYSGEDDDVQGLKRKLSREDKRLEEKIRLVNAEIYTLNRERRAKIQTKTKLEKELRKLGETDQDIRRALMRQKMRTKAQQKTEENSEWENRKTQKALDETQAEYDKLLYDNDDYEIEIKLSEKELEKLNAIMEENAAEKAFYDKWKEEKNKQEEEEAKSAAEQAEQEKMNDVDQKVNDQMSSLNKTLDETAQKKQDAIDSADAKKQEAEDAAESSDATERMNKAQEESDAKMNTSFADMNARFEKAMESTKPTTDTNDKSKEQSAESTENDEETL